MATKLKSIRVDEISLCRKGMNREANVVLYKSKDKQDISKSMFIDCLSEMKASQTINQMIEPLWDFNSALRSSIQNVVDDEDVVDKKQAIREIVMEYIKSIADMFVPIMDEVSTEKSCKKDKEKSKESVEVIMPESVKKEEVQKTDETIVINGVSISKSSVGESMFSVLKAQQEENVRVQEALKKAQDQVSLEKAEREKIEFIAKADALFPDISIESTKKGMLLQELMTKTSTDCQDVFLELMKSANALSKSLVKELGSGKKDDMNSSLQKYESMALEYSKTHNIPLHKAYVEIMNTSEGKALLNKEN